MMSRINEKCAELFTWSRKQFMQCRNRLWKKERASDVKLIHSDGSAEIIPVSSHKPQLAQFPDIINERDNERYAEWRAAIIKRDRRTCALCSSKEWIQVHHVIRWADDPSKRYDLRNGVCLCIPCHTKHHGPDMQPFPDEITADLMEHIDALYGRQAETTGCADKSIPAY